MATKKKDPDEIRLLELTIQNFRGLRFAHVKLDDEGRLIPVTGKNKAGKSSMLMGILSLVHGAKEAPTDPINDQAAEGEKSFVRGKFSNGFTVEERFTERGRYLTVLSEDGGEYKQGTLNEWIEGVSGDPIHLWSLRADRLLNVLLQTTTEPDAEERLAEFDDAVQRIREERTPHNSVIQAAQRMEAPDGERPEPVDLMALYPAIRELRQQDIERSNAEKDRSRALEMVEGAERKIAELESKLEEWRASLATHQERFQKLNERIDAMPDVVDEIDALEAEIQRAEDEEGVIEAWKRYDGIQGEAEKAKVESDRLTADLEEVQRQKAKYIAGIESNVEGLTFTVPEGETKITPLLHGRGLYAASGAEKARFQIDTMFALNPNLKIILLPDEGDAFDADYLKQIDADSRERGYQTWICRVQHGIEGEIKVVEGRTVDDENPS